MAFNVRPGGNAESVKVAEAIVSGDLVRSGQLVGIAQIDATEGEDGEFYTTLAIEGIAHYPVTGTPTAGAPLHTGTASGKVALKATGAAGDLIVGIATRDAANGRVFFKLTPGAGLVPTSA